MIHMYSSKSFSDVVVPCLTHQVAEIEYRMKSGYYAGQGLSSVKEDICRMCREAIR